MEEGKETSIKQLFQGMVPEGAVLLQGTVISVSPLKIKIVNDDKLVIGTNITVVPRHLQDYTTTVDIANGSINSRTREGDTLSTFSISGATMTVHNSLKAGDTVHIMSLQNGKKYYVLDRV